MKPSDKSQVDVLCIYCPETDSCYYVRPDHHGQSVTLRVTPSRNGQARNVLPADHFRAVPTPLPDTPGDLPVATVARQQDVVRPRHV